MGAGPICVGAGPPCMGTAPICMGAAPICVGADPSQAARQHPSVKRPGGPGLEDTRCRIRYWIAG